MTLFSTAYVNHIVNQAKSRSGTQPIKAGS